MSDFQHLPDSKESVSALSTQVAFSDKRSNRSAGKKRKYTEGILKHASPQGGCSVCKAGESRYKCPKCRSTYCSIACCRAHKGVCLPSSNSTGSDDLLDSGRPVHDHISQNQSQMISRSNYVSSSEFKELQSDVKRRYSTFSELRQKLRDDQIDEDLGPGWKMTDEMVAAMKGSRWLRNELADVGLQQLISKIVATSSHLPPNFRGSSHKKLNSMSTTTMREEMLTETKDKYPRFHTFLDKLLCLTDVYERRPLENGCLTPFEEWISQDNDESRSSFKGCELILKPIPKRERPSTPKVLPSSEDETDSSSDSSSDTSID